MIRILKYTEYVYLAIALLSAYKIYELWNADRQQSYIFIFFGVVSLGMFLFRRTYRKRFERRNGPPQ